MPRSTLGGSSLSCRLAAAPLGQAGIPAGVHVPGQYYYVTPCAGHVVKTYDLTNESGERRGVTRVYYTGQLGGTT